MPATTAATSSSRNTSPASRAAQPLSRNVVLGGAMGGGRRVVTTGISPGRRRVRRSGPRLLRGGPPRCPVAGRVGLHRPAPPACEAPSGRRTACRREDARGRSRRGGRGREDVPRLIDAAHRLGDVLAGMQVRVKALRQAPPGTGHLQRPRHRAGRPARRTDPGPRGWPSGRFYRPLAGVHRARLRLPMADRRPILMLIDGPAWSIAATSPCRR